MIAAIIYLSLVSIACGGMGLFLLWKRITLFINANRTVGDFVRWEQRGLRKTYYYPVVRFEANDGNVYEFIGGLGATSKKARARYAILYPPGNPQAAMIDGFAAFWLAPLAFFVLAAGAAAAAIHQ